MTDFNDYNVPGTRGAKRCDIVRTGWMGDWFNSFSPRNCNSNAEGTWAHWAELALSILQHPATAEYRPELHAAVTELDGIKHYDGGPRFSDEDVERLFGGGSDER